MILNILQICSQMNSYSDACMTLVSQNIEQIFSALEQSLQKDACQPLGFCDESQSKVCYHFRDERLLVKPFDDNALNLHSRFAFLSALCRMTGNSNPDSKNRQR